MKLRAHERYDALPIKGRKTYDWANGTRLAERGGGSAE